LLQKLSSTRYSQIVFYLLTVLLSYSLYHLFANTAARALRQQDAAGDCV
jgi:hypothetical protein